MSNNFLLAFKSYLTQNINPSLGLSNETPVILTLSPLEDVHCVMEIKVNNDGLDNFLKFPSTFINVEVPNLDPVYLNINLCSKIKLLFR
jgi:hypothetical protein